MSCSTFVSPPVTPRMPQLRAPTIIRKRARGSSLFSISIAFHLASRRSASCRSLQEITPPEGCGYSRRALQRPAVELREVLLGRLARVDERRALSHRVGSELRDRLLADAHLRQPARQPEARGQLPHPVGQGRSDVGARPSGLHADQLRDLAIAVGDTLAGGGVE